MSPRMEIDDLRNRVEAILKREPVNSTGKREYRSAYELGLLIYRRDPEYYESIGYGVGGEGCRQQNTLASSIGGLKRYLCPTGIDTEFDTKELSRYQVQENLTKMQLPGEQLIRPSQSKITAFRYRG
jgi:hypothetical protein